MNWIGLRTLLAKETWRFFKVYLQTILAPVCTTFLFFLVFAHTFGTRAAPDGQMSYTAFLIPGLIMMTIIQNAFANSSSSLIQSKVTGNIIFILLPPMSAVELFLGFAGAAVARGIVVGAAVYLTVAWWANEITIVHPVYFLAFSVLGSAIPATLGIIAGIHSEKFDHIAGFTNFVIMPLSFLSGVFYSIHTLPPTWQIASHLNPFFYMVDGFRFSLAGVSDISPVISLAVGATTFGILAAIALLMFQKGYKLRD